MWAPSEMEGGGRGEGCSGRGGGAAGPGVEQGTHHVIHPRRAGGRESAVIGTQIHTQVYIYKAMKFHSLPLTDEETLPVCPGWMRVWQDDVALRP